MRNPDLELLLRSLEEKGVSDPAVIGAISAIPREMFITANDLKPLAYEDAALPIECEQTISQPFIVAYMTERLRIGPDHEVLEIGTGSGYQTAILAQLARHVYTVERHQQLHELAVERFDRLMISNITAIVGDGTKGWPEDRLFDRILVAAGARHTPPALSEQLADCGLMIIPIGRKREQRLTLISRCAGGEEVQDLLPVRFVPLLAQV